jgi:hypothetical protein
MEIPMSRPDMPLLTHPFLFRHVRESVRLKTALWAYDNYVPAGAVPVTLNCTRAGAAKLSNVTDTISGAAA